MTPATLRTARTTLGLSTAGLAKLLRMGTDGGRHVRRWEAGTTPISGPASVAIEALLTGWRPVAHNPETV